MVRGAEQTPATDGPGNRHYPDRMSLHRSTSRDLALIAVFAAFIAVLGLPGALHPFGNAVPITLQTFGVMLAGCVLGARRAALAVATALLLVLAGMPLASGAAGPSAFVGPGGGFVLGWVAGAWMVGWLVQLWPRGLSFGWGFVANIVGGIVVIYVVGIPWMAAKAGMTLGQGIVVSWVYLPGDLIKAVLAAAIAAGVHRGYPGILPVRDRVEEGVR